MNTPGTKPEETPAFDAWIRRAIEAGVDSAIGRPVITSRYRTAREQEAIPKGSDLHDPEENV